MKVIIFGGDGFCGWPTALHLSAKGHQIVIVDNLSRRKIDLELEVNSLTPIQPMGTRLKAWKELTGKQITFYNFDIAVNYHRMLTLLKDFQPDAVIHFAEQRAAPYSMKSPYHKRYTVDNNISGTHNLLVAIEESGLSIHVVHLGTMGVYGYNTTGVPIPEGYLHVKVDAADGSTVEQDILYPSDAGSVYHMTKTLDQLLFSYYNKNDRIAVTDLHQGIVWGTQTDETSLDERLINRFDYDGDYGTVLNRFIVQTAIDHPLTVHGTGGQSRAFIHIRDTVQCVRMALESPPKPGERVCIRNQITEVHRVRDLANLVASLTGSKIVYLENPRNEAAENELLMASSSSFLQMGLTPITLQQELLTEVRDIARRYADNIDKEKIRCTSYWNKERKNAVERSAGA